MQALGCGQALRSYWGCQDKASMPTCVYVHPRTSFYFPMCSLKVNVNCEWEAFYICPLAKFFLVILYQKLQRQGLSGTLLTDNKVWPS